MKGLTRCAVYGCPNDIAGLGNLCGNHRVPGGIVEVQTRTGVSTLVITCWYAEHDAERGVIFLNDWALGHHFGGREGFEARLAEQGFTRVRNLATPEEMVTAKHWSKDKKVGHWGGPWRTEYPWQRDTREMGSDDPEQIALERALCRAIDRTAPYNRPPDGSEPPFWKNEMVN